MNRNIVAGNWKSNTRLDEAKELINAIASDSAGAASQIIVAPPAPYLAALKPLCGAHIALAAQNCSAHDAGAFTGEHTAQMLADVGVTHVIVGHSERRQLFGETDEVVAAKVMQVHSAGLHPIICVGETLEEREAGSYREVVKHQLQKGLFDVLDAAKAADAIIAYEPVWAIGTGRTASATQAQEMHLFIRQWVLEACGQKADQVPILYGGSVKPQNAEELFSQPDVDGGLIGGASLNANDFISIIKANDKWITAN